MIIHLLLAIKIYHFNNINHNIIQINKKRRKIIIKFMNTS
jgi:hypothetical protein